MTSDQEQFIGLAKKVFLSLVNTQTDSFLFHVKSLLQSIKDSDLKEKILSHFLTIAKNRNMEDDDYVLGTLLEQTNEKIRAETIALCQTLVESIKSTGIKSAEDFLCNTGIRLNNIEEGKPLAQQIFALVLPEFQQLLLESDTWSEHLCLLQIHYDDGR